MNTDWNQLQHKTHDKHHNYDPSNENAQARDGNILCNLSHYGLIVIAGSDAGDFIQGQFTNDISKVDAETAQLSALCNNKGRMIANFTLFQYQQNYFISLHQDLVDTVTEHLKKYILRAQVAIQSVTNQLIQTGISGEVACTKLATYLQVPDNMPLSQIKNTVYANADYIVIKTTDTQPRYQIFAEASKTSELWRSITNVATPVHTNAWEYLNIQAGIPITNAHSTEQFVPQMTNLELLDGISFSKGCYTGQEIVARMHYLGKLKKRMYKVHIGRRKNEAPPKAGDKIFAKNAKAGQNTGMLLDAQINPEIGYDALAVLQIADIDSLLTLHDAAGPAISIETLPYSLT